MEVRQTLNELTYMANNEPTKPEYAEPDFTPFDKQTPFVTDLWGLIPTVTSVPTHIPRKFSEQFRIYNGQLYYYDTSIPGWKASLITPITESDLSLSDVTTDNVSSTKHGFAPKSPADATQFLNGAATPAFAAVKDSDLSTSDITTNNVSTTKHGFVPKAPNDTSKFLRGDGTWATPASSSSVVLHFIANGSFAPADSTTYYISSTRLTSLETSATASTRIYIPISGTITKVYGVLTVGGTLGSSENITYAIRLNDTTNTNITTTGQATSASNAFSNTGLSISVTAGDYINLLMTTPAWTTNPTTCDLTASVLIT